MTQEQKDNIKVWLEALRSGAYKQGKNFLYKDENYCCLGVACEINNIEKILENDVYYYDFDGLFSTHLANIEWFTEKFGFDPRHFFKADVVKANATLPYLNDSYSLTFEQIADIIEQEFLK